MEGNVTGQCPYSTISQGQVGRSEMGLLTGVVRGLCLTTWFCTVSKTAPKIDTAAYLNAESFL